ncbi:SWIM zinc finger family protein [Streptomyces sp. GESEQ-35]|uniref:SWIM zinc finger family protein n=1 Tax=Streptomyces sp. GESEQ-35 TaxID=2812657 RepID=UPI001B32D581|nr:SWIM zinc finger family protein [Streptomyces sp. GESEQ-35]
MTGPVERGSAGGAEGDVPAPESDDERNADRTPVEEEPTGSAEARPADVARRALRAARERGKGVAGGSEGLQEASAGEEPGPDAGERPGARPGDAARAALRRAVAAAGSPGDGEDRPGTDAMPASHPSGPASDQPAARPADAAREVLRAALGEKRQAQTREGNGEHERTRRTRRPASAGTQALRGAGSGAADLRGRDVRELLADAFQMPSMDAPMDAPMDSAHGDAPPALSGSAARATSPVPADPGSPPTRPASGISPVSTAPAAPQVPHTMAAPGRDSELRRTFAAFAPRSPDHAGFAETWWGNAWVAALEGGALDPKRLARGRGYAGQGHVDAITVTPGLVLGYVRGSRPRPYRVQVRLRTLTDDDWARFLDAAADRPGHIAALLDKELPQSLADGGVRLLPGPGELDPHCSCPDRGHPCKHAAALCYQTARLLDADPFVLLLLRGRGERELLDALSRLSAARAARTAQEREPAQLPGVRATDAFAARQLPPLPAPLPAPPHPEQPPVYAGAPGGPDPFALDQLATDAAARAHALLSSGRDPVAELTLWQDAVRLAAARPGSGLTAATRALYSSLASAAGRTQAELARAVAAWRQGGLAGLAVLEDPWDPPAGRFDRARPLLLAADLPAFRPWRNRLTHPRGHVQLRLGREGLWYPYESEPDHDDWWPRGTPDLDPVGALTGLGASSEG